MLREFGLVSYKGIYWCEANVKLRNPANSKPMIFEELRINKMIILNY